ncbi:DUF4893 domain-containing protein [Sphingomonas sabuli]|uniref:DUF4893 domain-containing protein n=1 Tax=Sphingomonas sabuli TaxID=2764186 RepID=A0A7G9L5C5_9SPHN|nr:DUF4893 domain-containing protein [Sphingomonas sabuli]QNM83824.1 DUF4893 domain-containing protein [Sphingomonas sabuli]
MRIAILSLSLALAACSVVRPQPGVIIQPQRDWHRVVTQEDRARLRDWRSAFAAGVAAARADGHAAEVDKEGVLLQPDAALGPPGIPNGDYRCRVTKLGAKSEGLLNYIAYPYFACRVQQEEELQGFAKRTGSQRQVGLIFPGDQLRQVFLGTLMLGDEARPMQYGLDRERDVAGFVERIGPNRWRLVMPSPHFESKVDVMELVPAS